MLMVIYKDQLSLKLIFIDLKTLAKQRAYQCHVLLRTHELLSSSGPGPGPGPFLVISISLLFSPIQTKQTGPGGDVIFTLSPP